MSHQSAVILGLSVILATTAQASAAPVPPQQQAIWRVMDKCNKESMTKFPDLTKEGAEQRKKYIKTCEITYLGTAAPPTFRN